MSARVCTHLWLWPWQQHKRCALCGAVRTLHAGKYSIDASYYGAPGPAVHDVLRWSGTQAALAAGDAGMSAATGKLDAYIAAAGAAVPIVHALRSGLWIPTTDSPRLLAAAAQQVDFTGLDGDDDVMYRLVWVVENDSGGNCNYYLRPNGTITTNMRTTYINTVPGSSGNNTWELAFGSATQSALVGVEWIYASTAGPASGATIRRAWGASWRVQGSTGGALELRTTAWNETATNITSLRFYASAANGIGADSTIWLDKLGKVA